MKIILLSGYKGSGKDYIGDLIVGSLYKAKKTAFAEPLKDIASVILNISKDELDIHKNKKSPITIGGYEKTDVRVFLQKLGTEAMKPLFGEDVWSNLFLNKLEKLKSTTEFVVVTDFRFVVEYDALKDHGYDVITIRVRGNENSDDLHHSEVELINSNFKFDYYIDNQNKDDSIKYVVNNLLCYLYPEYSKDNIIKNMTIPDVSFDSLYAIFVKILSEQDKAHGLKHAMYVTDKIRTYIDEHYINVKYPFTVALLLGFIHDLFVHVDRENHHKLGHDLIINNKDVLLKILDGLITSDELDAIAEAILYHRSKSTKHLDSDNQLLSALRYADSDPLDLDAILKRSIMFHSNSDLTNEDIAKHVLKHMHDKFGRYGYRYGVDVVDVVTADHEKLWSDIDNLTLREIIDMM